MGPAMVLCQVSGEELDRLFADPTLIEQFMEDVDARLAAPLEAAYGPRSQSEITQPGILTVLLWSLGLKKRPDPPPPPVPKSDEELEVERGERVAKAKEFERLTDWLGFLGEDWHIIHCLLTGSATGGPKPASLLLTAREIGDLEVEFGTARGLTVDETKEFAAFLQSIDLKELRDAQDHSWILREDVYFYDFDRLNDDSEDGGWAYFQDRFDYMKSFVMRTAAKGQGMIVCLSID